MAIEAAQLMVKIGADVSGLSNGMNQADGIVKNAGKAMTQVGQTLTMGVTMPLIGIGTMAVKAGMEYETAMNVMQNNSSATAAEFAKLGDLAVKLGADVKLPGTSAKDAAEAMNELAKSGISVTDIMAGTRPVLEMSAAGNISNALAAEIASNAMNVFGLSGSDMARVADLMAASANASSAEITDMADAMKMSGSVMKMAKIPIEDLTTWLGQMANMGMKGSDAGTSLKQMMLTLMTPTDKAAGMMQDLGISVYDTNGQMKSARNIVAMFSEKLGGLTDQERDFTMGTLFGSDAVRAANTVFLSGVDAFDKMKVAVTKQGAASEAATARNKGLQGALDALNSAVETAFLGIKDSLDPMIRQFADGLSTLVNRFTELDPGMQSMIVWGAVIMAALGPVLMIFGAIATGLAAISAPMWIIIGLAALLGAAWATNFGGIQEKTKAVWEYIQPILSSLWTWLQTNIPIAIQALAQLWTGTLQPAIAAVWQFIQANVIPVLSTLFNWLKVNMPLAIAELTRVWNSSLLPALNAVWAFIQANVIPVFQALWSFISTYIVPLFVAMASVELALLGVALKAIWTVIVDWVIPGFTAIIGAFQRTIDFGRPLIDWFTNNFIHTMDIVGNAINEVIKLFNDMSSAISNFKMPSFPNPFDSGNTPSTSPYGYASGGSVFGGKRILVGERGPELFVPRGAGTIVPNDELRSGRSGGSAVINLGGITINGNADANTVRTAARDGVLSAARSMGMSVA